MERGKKRKQKTNPTIEAVRRYNQKKAERELAVIMNTNFSAGDLHIVLTFSGEEPGLEDAKRALNNFKKTMRRRYRKHGMVFRWIAVTEYENKRIHHHMVISKGLSVEEISAIWGAGIVRTSALEQSGDYRRLASYLIKETSKTFRSDSAVQRQRYSCSKNIVRPVTKKETVAPSALVKDPKPFKGYYIDQDSIWKGSNPVTGMPFVEYVMVSLEEKPRMKRWSHGRKVNAAEESDRWIRWMRRNREHQAEMDLESAQADIL